jgi:hypothetical protein
MAHTEQGSFIIPILVPLSDPGQPVGGEPDQSALIEITTGVAEPLERRVTRTLAQSLNAVDRVIVQPESEPTLRDLHEVVERGVSREFCAALSRVLTDRNIAHFGAQFEWAESVPPPATLPKSVDLPSAASDRLRRAAEKLKKNPIDLRQIFSGDIVELRYKSGEPNAYIWVSTIRNGRQCEIRVTLSVDAYRVSLDWHQNGRPVLVEGEVHGGRGKKLTVESPIRCRPVDEMMLPSP